MINQQKVLSPCRCMEEHNSASLHASDKTSLISGLQSKNSWKMLVWQPGTPVLSNCWTAAITKQCYTLPICICEKQQLLEQGSCYFSISILDLSIVTISNPCFLFQMWEFVGYKHLAIGNKKRCYSFISNIHQQWLLLLWDMQRQNAKNQSLNWLHFWIFLV